MNIKRILSVKDTREFIEDGDRFIPVPGSGDANDCARCGRYHEVHATVELEDGTTTVVGTGCAGSRSMVRKATSLAAVATRLGAMRAEERKLRDRLGTIDNGMVSVSKMEMPAITRTPAPLANCPHRIEIRCGDAKVFTIDGRFARSSEDDRRARKAWEERRLMEILGESRFVDRWPVSQRLSSILADIKKAEKKLAGA